MRSNLAIAILLAVLMLTTMAVTAPISSAAVVTSDPIHIANDTDLVAEAGAHNWPGSGTETDPYVISNLSFEGDRFGLYADYVTLHLVIRDCTFTNCAIAIEMDMCSNVTVTQNTIKDGYEAMVIYAGSDNIVCGNTVANMSYGFYLSETSGITVCHNTFNDLEDYDVLLEGSDANVITKNSVDACGWAAICLAYSDNNTITDNVIVNSVYGVYLEYLGAGNVITGNTVSGCDEEYKGIYITGAPDENTVSDNTITFKASENSSGDTLLIAGLAIVIVALLAALFVTMKRKKA